MTQIYKSKYGIEYLFNRSRKLNSLCQPNSENTHIHNVACRGTNQNVFAAAQLNVNPSFEDLNVDYNN